MMTAAARSAAAKKAHETMRARKLLPPQKPKPRPKLAPQTKIVLPKEVKSVSTANMMLNTVILVLTINGIGNRRKVDPNSVEITDSQTQEEVNKDWLGITRKLMDAPELKTIQSIGNKAKAYVNSRALPSGIKLGVYLLPKIFSDETDEKLNGFVTEMQPHVEALAANLPKYKKEAKAQQGPQFNEEQFPTAAEIRAAFRISWRYLYIDSAKGLSKKLEEEERKKSEAAWTETRETIKQLLRTQLCDMVNHMVERLQPGDDGKAKGFRHSEKMQDFLATFDVKNNSLLNDVQMKILVDKAKALVATADAETIRSDKTVAEYIRHGFETIKTLLDPMVKNKPHRAIELD